MIPLFLLIFYIPVTKWVSPEGSIPLTYTQYISQNLPKPFEYEKKYRSLNRSSNIILILCEKELSNALEEEINEYIQTLESKNWEVILYEVNGGTPEELKEFITEIFQSTWAELDLVFMIGKLPVAWFQLIDDWDNDGERDEDDWYEEFPCDLFYEDIDGFWADSLKKAGDNLIPGHDGIYDTHSGSIYPEITVSRLYPVSSFSSQDIPLFKNYFKKLKKYREKTDTLLHRALLYIDDDWRYWASEYSHDMEELFEERTVISDPEETIASDYKNRLSQNYKWVSVFAHSSPHVHGFKYNNGNSWSWIYASEIPSIDPKAYFYNLFACSNCRYVETGYMGGKYILAPSYGLSAVGSAKTGSMLFFYDFYHAMASGRTVGEALKEWFRKRDLTQPWQRSWFYGITLLGDPSLSPIEEPPQGIEETIAEKYKNNPVLFGFKFKKEIPSEIKIYSPDGRLIKKANSPFYIQLPNKGVYFYEYQLKGKTFKGKIVSF